MRQYGSVHGHHHFDGRTPVEGATRRSRTGRVDVSSRARVAVLAVVALLAAATVVGLVLLWPTGDLAHPDFAGEGSSVQHGVVDSVRDASCADGSEDRCGSARVVLVDGPERGQTFTVALTPDVMTTGLTDRVVLVRSLSGGMPTYQLQDLARGYSLVVLGLLFVVVVAVVARARGLLAIVGLAFAGAVMYWFMLPALLRGSDPVWVGLTASGAIMLVVLYLAHGVSTRTSTALLGTFVGLGLTAGVAVWSVQYTHLTGVTGDETSLLRQQVSALSLRDLLLCAVLLAGIGVLNDVTITQTSAVWELRSAAPDLGRRALFAKGMRIGRDHIASTIYTIVFAYAGASLGVLMLIALYAQPLSFTLTSEDIAEEVVRTLSSAIGLVLAVPVTTALAVVVVPAAVRGARDDGHGAAATARSWGVRRGRRAGRRR